MQPIGLLHAAIARNAVQEEGIEPGAMRRGDLANDPRFATAQLRRQNFAELHAIVQAWILTFRDMALLDAQLDEAKVAMGEVRTTEELAKTEWAEYWGAVQEVSDRRGTPTSTSRIVWTTTDDGVLVAEPAPRFGAYAARFTPGRGLHDRVAVIDALVEPELHARQRIEVDTAPARVATARVGLISNFGGLFGQTAFLEAALPYPKDVGLLRLFSLGLSVGYIHGEVSSNATVPTGPTTAQSESLETEMNQLPLLAFLRMHLPVRWPVEISAAGLIGVTWLASSTTDLSSGMTISTGSAWGLALGLGGDVALPLRPGEFVIGLRYLDLSVGRLSNGDRLSGNAGGMVADLGFRLRL